MRFFGQAQLFASPATSWDILSACPYKPRCPCPCSCVWAPQVSGARDRPPGLTSPRMLEVVPCFEILDQPGLGRLPAQQFAGQRAGRRAVEPEEAGQPGEVRGGVLGRRRRPPGRRDAGRSPRRWRGSARPRRRPRAVSIPPGRAPPPGGTGAPRRAGARRASGWTRRRGSRRRLCRGRCATIVAMKP